MKDKAKIITLVLALIVVLVATGVGVYLFNQSQNLESDASGTSVMYFSDPTPVNPQKVDQEFTIDVFVDSDGDLISAVDSEISFNPEFLQVVDVSTEGTLFSAIEENDYDNNTGDIVLSLSVGGDGSALEGVQFIGTITFKPLAATAGTQLSFNFTEEGLRNDSNVSPFVAENSGNETEDLLQSAPSTTIVIEEGESGVFLYYDNLVPSNNQTVNETFTVDIKVDTNGLDISGVDAVGNFDTSLLQIESIDTSSSTSFLSFASPVRDNNNGTFVISGDNGTGQDNDPINGNGLLVATITYQPIANGTTDLTFDFTLGERNDSNASEFLASGLESEDLLTSVNTMPIIIGGGTTTTPSPTPVVTPSPTPTVSTTPSPSPTPDTGGPDPSPTPTPTPVATPTPTPVTTFTPKPTTTTDDGSSTSDGDDTGGPDGETGTQPDLPEELPETASPQQTVGIVLIAVSFIASGLLFSYKPKEG